MKISKVTTFPYLLKKKKIKKKVTLSQGALYGVPWRWIGWVCQKRLHLQGPVSAPGSGAGNDCRGWIVVDLRPLLSRNCPTATGATREYILFLLRSFTHWSRQTVWKDLRLTVCNLDAAASHFCKSISIAASEFIAIVSIKTSTKNRKHHIKLKCIQSWERKNSNRMSLAKVKVRQRQAFVKATYMAVEQRASLTG